MLVGGLVGGLFGREGGGCRGEGAGWGVGGVGGCWELLGGGEKGQGGDLVMEFMSAEAPPTNPPPCPGGIQKSKLHAELTGWRALEPPY